MDLSSQRQYIQRAVNAKLDVSGTASLETIYTAPSGGDFDFAIVESLLVGDDDFLYLGYFFSSSISSFISSSYL